MPLKQKLNKDFEFIDLFLVQHTNNNTNCGYGSSDIADAFIFYLPMDECIITEEKYNYYIKELEKTEVSTL